MAYKPFPKQAEAHAAFLVDGYKRGLLYWGRRTGKTMWSVQQLIYSCILNQGQHFIVFKEYQQAETVAWNQYLHLIPKAMIADLNKSRLEITFKHFGTDANGNATWVTFPDPIGRVRIEHDTSKPPSSIRLLGSDRADQHRGGQAEGMIFDEYQDQDSYGWDFVYKQFFATTDGWAAFMGTAKDDMEWEAFIDRADNSDRWYYSKALWDANPLIKKEWIEEERKEAEEEGKLASFLQEMYLIPFSQQGAVYDMFNRDIHVIPHDEVPEEGEDYVGLDFGYAEGHPMAAVFVRIDAKTDTWYQYDEIYGTRMQIDEEFIGLLKSKLGDRRLTAIVADSARPDLIEFLQSKGLPVIPAPKKQGSVESGITLVAKRLKPKTQIIGDPKPNYYLTPNCKNTISDFRHYKYKEPKKDRLPSENPVKDHDDTMDALRYLELHFKFGLQKDSKPITSSAIKNLNEYGI